MSGPADPVRAVRRGHFANCSATGSVVGLALLSIAAVGAITSAFADRFARWAAGPGPAGGPPDEGEHPGAGPAAAEQPGASDRPSPPEPKANSPAALPPRVRWEGDGAVVAWPEPPALVEVDPQVARALLGAGATAVGGDAPVPGALTAPTEVHVALGARCGAGCTGCYQDARPDGALAGREALERDLDELARMGVFEIALGGGEPLRNPLLEPMVARVVARGMVANVTTSGLGLDADRARWLARHTGQVNVSLDGIGATYAAARGWDGAAVALRAIRLLREAGARVGVNTVLMVSNIDQLDTIADTLVALGVSEWHWIRFKPVGRGRPEAAAELGGLAGRLLAIEARTGLQIRVDCALVPLLVADFPDVEALRRLGVTGCAGGHSLWARDTNGRFAPCSYAAGQAPGVDLPPAEAWREDPTLRVWRERRPPEPCASCPAQAICRGGCRVVAAARLGDAMAADPDCPRVRAWSA